MPNKKRLMNFLQLLHIPTNTHFGTKPGLNHHDLVASNKTIQSKGFSSSLEETSSKDLYDSPSQMKTNLRWLITNPLGAPY